MKKSIIIETLQWTLEATMQEWLNTKKELAEVRMAENDKDGVKLWKEVAQKEIERLSRYFKDIDRPISYIAQLYKNWLELPN